MRRALAAFFATAIVATVIFATAFGTTAHAGKPTLVALAPASDARKAVAIGPAGEVYEPDGKGAWVRTQAGGTAVEIVGATSVGGTVIAAAKGAPPFKLKATGWTAIHLAPRARAIVGSGSRVLAAVGKSVFALDKGQPTKLADAPGGVRSLAASKAGAVIVTDKGIHRLEGGTWKLVKKAPKAVRALVSDRWALVDRGALDLKTLKMVVWPAGLRIAEATTVGDTLVAVATHGKKHELLTVKAGKGKKQSEVEREEIPLDGAAPIVGLVVDRDRRAVVAARDGKLAVREAGATGAWTTTEVRVELAPAKTGPAPAISEAQPGP